MKMIKRIVASNGDEILEVTIKYKTTNPSWLTRDEVRRRVRSMARGIHQSIQTEFHPEDIHFR